MSSQELSLLQQRVRELEMEVLDREKELALYRAELISTNQRLERLVVQIHQEIKVAQAIQKAIVPTDFPNIQGFEFSTKFVPSMIQGGDYFDIFNHEDRLRFGLILASGSGHTMSALFLSVLLKYTGQMEARKGSAPDAILSQLAAELIPNMDIGSQAEIFYGLIDRRNFELSFCKLGHVVGFHYSYADNELKLLPSTGESIVETSPTTMKMHSLNLNPKDRLVLCSPGVATTTNLEGEIFGILRLSKVIHEIVRSGVHEIRNQILFQVHQFSGGQEIPRDRTVLVLEVKDNVLKLAP